MKRILIVDDEPGIRKQLATLISKDGFETSTAAKGSEALKLVRKQSFELALLDFRLPDMDGLELLKKIKILSPNTVCIIITGYSDVRIAVKSIREGAYDYVTKPIYADEIKMIIKEALQKEGKKKTKENSEIIIGKSTAAREISSRIRLVAPTDMSVIISGETGTGKEYAARAIHNQSERKNRKMIAVDCGALPENLAGSELFGHMKGAFTGAVANKKGSFELADKGTLFLDEVGNLSYENQMKLLRVLHEKKVKRIGGTSDTEVDVRIIAATNEDLKMAVEKGKFREDLYHRLNEFNIDLPPLREREDDIVYFMKVFLNEANDQLNKNVSGVDEDALLKIKGYAWHGNIRELKNVMKRAVLLTRTNRITLRELPGEIAGMSSSGGSAQVDIESEGLKSVSEHAERNAIIEVLEKTEFNKTRAAEILQIDRKTLYNKMKNYNIDLDKEEIS